MQKDYSRQFSPLLRAKQAGREANPVRSMQSNFFVGLAKSQTNIVVRNFLAKCLYPVNFVCELSKYHINGYDWRQYHDKNT